MLICLLHYFIDDKYDIRFPIFPVLRVFGRQSRDLAIDTVVPAYVIFLTALRHC